MANLFEKYETDPQKESEGVPVEIDGAVFFVRRAGGNNRGYRYALGIAARDYQHILTDENRDEQAIFAANETIQQLAFARTVIAGWDNVQDRNGEPLTFSYDAALDLIQACPAVWDRLREVAIDDNFYRPEVDGELLGKRLSGQKPMAKKSKP